MKLYKLQKKFLNSKSLKITKFPKMPKNLKTIKTTKKYFAFI